MRARCLHCGHEIEAVKTLVAVRDKTTETVVVNLLKESGFEVLTAREGREIFVLLESCRPEVTVLDGDFPGVFGLHFVEIIKKSPRLQGTRVILVSTVPEGAFPEKATASRGGPMADAILEGHQLQKNLLITIQELLPERFSPETPLAEAEKEMLPNEEAKRFARIIISDIALYNPEKVAEGNRNGTFFELLKDDIQEGRELFRRRFPAVVNTVDYYEEAITDFLRPPQ